MKQKSLMTLAQAIDHLEHWAAGDDRRAQEEARLLLLEELALTAERDQLAEPVRVKVDALQRELARSERVICLIACVVITILGMFVATAVYLEVPL